MNKNNNNNPHPPPPKKIISDCNCGEYISHVSVFRYNVFVFVLLQENGPSDIKRMKTDEEFMLGKVSREEVLHKSDIKMDIFHVTCRRTYSFAIYIFIYI
jgi:hypothetical protein